MLKNETGDNLIDRRNRKEDDTYLYRESFQALTERKDTGHFGTIMDDAIDQ